MEEIITLIIVGAIAGMAAASVLERGAKKKSWLRNTVIGILGAILGGFIFDALNIDILSEYAINLGTILAAFVGALLVIVILRFLN